MNRRTFEVLAKYIAKANNITVVFDTDEGAFADMKKKVIHLPRAIGKNKVFAALALLMHEAAHLIHSTKIPLAKMCSDEIDHSILNSIEDSRIDKMNYNKLPNIRDFYEQLMKDFVYPLPATAPFEHKVLATTLLESEGWRGYQDKDVQDFISKHSMLNKFWSAENAISCSKWDELKKGILEIRGLLYPNSPPGSGPKLQNPNAEGEGQGDESKGKCAGKGDGEGQGQDGAKGKSVKPGDLDKILKPNGKVFSCDGDDLSGGSANDIGEAAFEEKTLQEFKNLLNIKERKIIQTGTTLDTDNLVAFLTGDIDSLFKTEVYERKKKSKLLFLLDASGSMTDRLIDKQPRWHVVSKCVKKLTNVLREVIELEGLNVDWDVSMFQGSYYPLEKDNWEKEYKPGGGTNLARAFRQAITSMKEDYETEGKKIVIVFSDGDVDIKQVDQVRDDIQASGEDIRVLIVGVGTSLTGSFAKKITGDRVIIAEENANNVLIDSIREMM